MITSKVEDRYTGLRFSSKPTQVGGEMAFRRPSRVRERHARKNADEARYFLSRGGVAVACVGVEPLGASGMTGAGAFFAFFASLLPRWPLDMLVSLIVVVA